MDQETFDSLEAWPAPTSRDFPAEWHEENGSYLNKCCECNEQFIGRKRRVVCRDCLDVNKDKQIKELEAQVAHKDKVIDVLINQLIADSFWRDECPLCERKPFMNFDHVPCWIQWVDAKATEVE